jgi:twitching motility protein PilT
VEYKSGLVLVTGPTGSGKSTTLAAMVDVINKEREDHIITLEDPVEFIHPKGLALIHQRQVGLHVNTFSDGLRAAMREDPNVILVGEMRDLETIHLALTAAETGLLVLGTLHTASAAQTIGRVIDAFPSAQQPLIKTMLSESLRGVVAQQLLRRKDGGGRVAAVEVMFNTQGIRSLVRDGKTHQILSMIQTGQSSGMVTMEKRVQWLLSEGLVSEEEAKPFLTG